MENILQIGFVVLVLGAVIYLVGFYALPAGYHEKNSDGSYTPAQTTLWKELTK